MCFIFAADHTPYHIDLDISQLFSEATHPLVSLPLCRLQLHDPRKVDNCIDLLLQHVECQKLIDKIFNLILILDSVQWTLSHIEEYEKIDKTYD